jgi:transposase-like protein
VSCSIAAAGCSGHALAVADSPLNVNCRAAPAHFAEIYGASVSKETIGRIADKVIEEMNVWAVLPRDRGGFIRRFSSTRSW